MNRLLPVLLVCALDACGRTYYVETNGIDSDTRDGRSPQSAWQSLAYASQRVVGPRDTIRLGRGTFTETQPSNLPDSIAIIGVDTASTRVRGASTWSLSGSPRDVNNNRANYLVSAANRKGLTVARISFSSHDTSRLLHGALWFLHCTGVEIAECAFENFAWNGVCLLQSSHINLHHCRFHNASLTRDQWSGGQILVRWISHSDIHHNVITKDRGDGYGYKAQDAGHRNVRIRNNIIGDHYFAIESAHDFEYNLEICYNELAGCISVPKWEGGLQTLPSGIDYAVRIHHNVMYDSYGIEGPRNYLRIDSNYVFITKTGGRFYTQHLTSVCLGPVWIHHNVIVNVDRGFVWAHDAGVANNFHIYHNTVYCADAQQRTEAILGIPDSAQNWTFQNNIVVAPSVRPRTLFNNASKGARVVTATNNVFVNVTGTPLDNWNNVEPGLKLSGDAPYPYYAPIGAESFVVDRGANLGMPFVGVAPDIGAYEYESGGSVVVTRQDRTERIMDRFLQRRGVRTFDLRGRSSVTTLSGAGAIGTTTPIERGEWKARNQKAVNVLIETR